jgi:hypothetical protein
MATPKKDIVRSLTNTLPDGSPIPRIPGFTYKESLFIFWYIYPGSEAFQNAGRAAARAGYAGNAVTQGYLLKRKPKIAKKIKEFIIPVRERIREAMWQVLQVSMIRMEFDVIDFYRPVKRTVKMGRGTMEIDDYEIVPLHELTWQQRMCIDGIYFMGKEGIPNYKLPNRDQAYKTFMKCYKRLFPADFPDNREQRDRDETLEIIRERIQLIVPRDGKAPENPIEANADGSL